MTRRGKVRPARGGGGAGSGVGGSGANQGPDGGARGGRGGGGGASGGARPRTKLQRSDTRPNIYTQPNEVVLEYQEFSVLPPDEEVVDFNE